MFGKSGGDAGGMGGGADGFDPMASKMKMLQDLADWASKGQADELKSAYRQGPGAEVPMKVDAEGAVVEKPAIDVDGAPVVDASMDDPLSALDDEAVRKLLGDMGDLGA